jgi:hypothetical protein
VLRLSADGSGGNGDHGTSSTTETRRYGGILKLCGVSDAIAVSPTLGRRRVRVIRPRLPAKVLAVPVRLPVLALKTLVAGPGFDQRAASRTGTDL